MAKFLPKRTKEMNFENPTTTNLETNLQLKKSEKEENLRKSTSKWAPKRTQELEQLEDTDELINIGMGLIKVQNETPKSRAREVLGIINGETPQPSIFKNVRSPPMITIKENDIHDKFSMSIYVKVEDDEILPTRFSTQMQHSEENLKNAMNGKFNEFQLKIKTKNILIDGVLGKGGSSMVFCGAHDQTPLAVKVIDVGEDTEKIRSFQLEVNLLKRLQSVPFVVNLIESDLHKDLAIIVMECGNSDLYKHLLTYTSDIPLYHIALWFHDMTSAVAAIHKLGIVHADLKPSNYLVMPSGRLKLTDFGISKVKQRLSDASMLPSEPEIVLAGTMNFLCPEAVDSIIKRKALTVNETVDIWSLGVIFYYLLYKELPFGRFLDKKAKMLAIASSETELKFAKLPKFYPEMLKELCKSCLQHIADLRPSADDLLSLYPMGMIVKIKDEYNR